jgi:hypothetical protein
MALLDATPVVDTHEGGNCQFALHIRGRIDLPVDGRVVVRVGGGGRSCLGVGADGPESTVPELKPRVIVGGGRTKPASRTEELQSSEQADPVP